MHVNQVDAGIAPIAETYFKSKNKNIKNVQRHYVSKEYTELVKNVPVQKELRSEKYNIYNDYPNCEKKYKKQKKIYQKVNEADTQLAAEPNVNEKKSWERQSNWIEHYNLMSGTDTGLSSNGSIADMYETNYDYFSKRKCSMSEISLESSHSRQKLKLDSIRNNQNDDFEKDKKVYMLPKVYGIRPFNVERFRNGNILTNHPNSNKNKKLQMKYMSNGVYQEGSNSNIPITNSVMNFNPLVCVNSRNSYYTSFNRYNCNENQHSYNRSNNSGNYSFHYDHPPCEFHDKCFHTADKVNKNSHYLYSTNKSILKYQNYLKDVCLSNKHYMEEELRKKCCHYFLPLRRPYYQENYQSGNDDPRFIARKRVTHRRGTHNSDVNSYDDYIAHSKSVSNGDSPEQDNIRTHQNGVKYKTCSYNLKKRRSKGNEYYRRKNTLNNGTLYLSKKKKFSQLLKNLKLLGYALFFCFFISNQNKSTKEKQTSICARKNMKK
ncbi:hypothetical protein PGO_131090 [Plasmodium gonderi]|uniref:Uncharacterized protein n=1 Tax=Plasmodium gonderi TaxID=77519 RepID=A0A1Y1JNL8_PLAGO|nr:hypothetical protein PGO_131090 [Plasmodium gonderi]GAW82837.1 hypothetical protein PGO_131090 [Plasmodium gonderi]